MTLLPHANKSGAMKYRRGIELGRPRRDAIFYIGPVPDLIGTALDDVAEFRAVGVMCSACEREAWIDRRAANGATRSLGHCSPAFAALDAATKQAIVG